MLLAHRRPILPDPVPPCAQGRLGLVCEKRPVEKQGENSYAIRRSGAHAEEFLCPTCPPLQAIEIRAMFERDRDVRDPRRVAAMLQQVESNLNKYRHPDPYRRESASSPPSARGEVSCGMGSLKALIDELQLRLLFTDIHTSYCSTNGTRWNKMVCTTCEGHLVTLC